MIFLTDIYTAIDKGYEQLAAFRYDSIKSSTLSGDSTVCNTLDNKALYLYSYISALEDMNFNHSIIENKRIERIYYNIKDLTKEIKLWD